MITTMVKNKLAHREKRIAVEALVHKPFSAITLVQLQAITFKRYTTHYKRQTIRLMFV